MKDLDPRGVEIAAPSGSLVTNVVEFCRLLNSHGISVAPGSSEVALRAIRSINLPGRVEFQSALRICLLTKPEDIPVFTHLFNAYWKPGDNEGFVKQDQPDPVDENQQPPKLRSSDRQASPSDRDPTWLSTSERNGSEPPSETQHPDKRALASRWALSNTANVVDNSDPDPRELERIARALTKKLAVRRSRRKESHRNGKYLDVRTILRKSVRNGGIPVELSWRRPKITRARLIVLCDVSRSMEPYARLLLHFSAAVLRQAWRVDVFLFANHLIKVGSRWIDFKLTDLEGSAADIGVGTQIGSSFAQFLDHFPHDLTGNQSTIIILSDGLDAGEPEILRNAMIRMRRRTRRIIWLNPLLSTSGYEPTARGMAAALPLVDVFAPASDTTSLWQMVDQLNSRY